MKIIKNVQEILGKAGVNFGFTLLELVIVIAILSILSGFIWTNFFSSLLKGRDSKRKQDLDSISKALELYYYDFGAYPTNIPGPGTPFVNPTVTGVVYLQEIPADPQNPSRSYCYATDSDKSYYQLYAFLENGNDPQIIPTITCGPKNYNYGISSSNTTP